MGRSRRDARCGMTGKATGTEARTNTNGSLAPDELERLGSMQSVVQEPTSDRDDLLRYVNARLTPPAGKRIVDVLELGDDLPEFDLVLEDGTRIAAGGAKNVLDPRHMDAVLAPKWKSDLPYCTPKEFRPIGMSIIRSGRPVSGTGGQPDETKEWLASLMEWLEGFPRNVDLDDGPVLGRALQALVRDSRGDRPDHAG